MSLKDISIYDRPREKAEIYGVKTLSDIELLAIIIETGYHGENVLSLAAKLLEKSGGLSNLSKLNLSELNIKGLKKAKSIRLLAAIELGKRASSNIEFSVPIKDQMICFCVLRICLSMSQKKKPMSFLLITRKDL